MNEALNNSIDAATGTVAIKSQRNDAVSAITAVHNEKNMTIASKRNDTVTEAETMISKPTIVQHKDDLTASSHSVPCVYTYHRSNGKSTSLKRIVLTEMECDQTSFISKGRIRSAHNTRAFQNKRVQDSKKQGTKTSFKANKTFQHPKIKTQKKAVPFSGEHKNVSCKIHQADIDHTYSIETVQNKAADHAYSTETVLNITDETSQDLRVRTEICETDQNETATNTCEVDLKETLMRYACETCDERFTTPHYLKRHVKVCTSETKYLCEICGSMFARRDGLFRHKAVHSGERPHQCEICGKSYSCSGHLKVHMRSHTGEKPFQCDVCGKSFVKNSVLRVHKRSHTGEKAYECPICEKSFTANQYLTRHLRTHTKERPYKCKECGNAFADKSTLNVHIQTHNPDRPYVECTICGEKFMSSGGLWHHRKMKHNSAL